MPARFPRVQVTVDPELEAALKEFGGPSRSRAVRDLAVRGAQALREEHHRRQEALELLRRISDGEDDRFDFSRCPPSSMRRAAEPYGSGAALVLLTREEIAGWVEVVE